MKWAAIFAKQGSAVSGMPVPLKAGSARWPTLRKNGAVSFLDQAINHF
jgi:hypothetical protein